MMRGVDKGAIVRVQGGAGVGIDLRGGTYQDVVMYVREWPLGKASATNANGVWQHVRIEVRGERHRVLVNGQLRLDRTDARRAQDASTLSRTPAARGAARCTTTTWS
jgi:hypothetical protein